MGKFDGVLLASDLDGTLLSTDHQPSRENIDAIRYFTGEGGSFTCATGRMVNAAGLFFDCVALNAPVVVFNGAAIYDTKQKKTLYELPLPEEAYALVPEVARRFPQIGIEVHTVDHSYAYQGGFYTQRHFSIVNLDYHLTPLEQMERPWMKLILSCDPAFQQEVVRYMNADGRSAPYDLCCSTPYFYEVMRRGVNKAVGIEKLRCHLGIAPEHVYTVGDNENDVEMLKAFYSYAVRGASAGALAAARETLSSGNDEHAIREVIERLDGRY